MLCFLQSQIITLDQGCKGFLISCQEGQLPLTSGTHALNRFPVLVTKQNWWCEEFRPSNIIYLGVSAALQILNDAMASGQLSRGGCVTEGTAGSTGVSLALVSNRSLPLQQCSAILLSRYVPDASRRSVWWATVDQSVPALLILRAPFLCLVQNCQSDTLCDPALHDAP